MEDIGRLLRNLGLGEGEMPSPEKVDAILGAIGMEPRQTFCHVVDGYKGRRLSLDTFIHQYNNDKPLAKYFDGIIRLDVRGCEDLETIDEDILSLVSVVNVTNCPRIQGENIINNVYSMRTDDGHRYSEVGFFGCSEMTIGEINRTPKKGPVSIIVLSECGIVGGDSVDTGPLFQVCDVITTLMCHKVPWDDKKMFLQWTNINSSDGSLPMQMVDILKEAMNELQNRRV